MTALAMIIGMIPMALGMGEGGEQNAPLGRAVIGGLIVATIATLTFVPAVFGILHRRRRRKLIDHADQDRSIVNSPRRATQRETATPASRTSPGAPRVCRCHLRRACLRYPRRNQSRQRSAAELRSATLDAAVPTVSVVRPEFEATPEEIVLPGNVQAFISTPIYARTNGYLRHWYFDIGSHVRAGQLLAEIETPEVDRQLDQSRADLATATGKLQARGIHRRPLSESAPDRFCVAAGYRRKGRRYAGQEGCGGLSRRERAPARRNSALPESLCTVRRRYHCAQHRYGRAHQSGANAPGKELFDIAATNRLRVFVNIPQTYLRSAVSGVPAYLTAAEFPGRVRRRIVRNSEAIDPASRTLLTEVDVDNRDGTLLPGQYVSVHLAAGGKHRA